jgi:ClpP class serine protease
MSNFVYFSVYSKRTITPTKKVTKEDYQKSKEDIEEVFGLFRDFVKENRPKLDIDKVATGETWFGTAAMELKLCMFCCFFNSLSRYMRLDSSPHYLIFATLC